jgi:hypothetical protein
MVPEHHCEKALSLVGGSSRSNPLCSLQPLSAGAASRTHKQQKTTKTQGAAEDRSKPAKAVSEALGVGLLVTFVLGVGTTWAWIVVQLAVMVSQVEPFLVRNILWTQQ